MRTLVIFKVTLCEHSSSLEVLKDIWKEMDKGLDHAKKLMIPSDQGNVYERKLDRHPLILLHQHTDHSYLFEQIGEVIRVQVASMMATTPHLMNEVGS